MRNSPMIGSFGGGEITCYRFPLPSEPAAYGVYLVIRNSVHPGQLPTSVCKRINRTIAAPHISQVHICSPRANCREMRFENWNGAAQEELQTLGLSWLIPPGQSPTLFLRSVDGHSGVELPFVPEFAHDLSRAKMLLDGRFQEILPMTAEFVPSLNCPFRCRQCSYRHHKFACGAWSMNDLNNPRWQMDKGIAATLVQKLSDAGVRNLVVTGGGEPLMNPEATLAGLKKARECGLKTGLYTNGALLTRQLVQSVLDEDPCFIRVSMNAGSDLVHTKYHMPVEEKSMFRRVQNGVKELALVRARLQKNTEIGLSYIVNPMNSHDCAKFAHWVARTAERVANKVQRSQPAIDFVRFTPTVDYTGDRQFSQDFFNQTVEAIRKDAVPILDRVGVSTVLFTHRFDHIEERKPYEECLGCSWFAEVAPEGSVYMCSETNFLPGYRFGNLIKDRLEDIWAGRARQEVLSRVNGSRLRGCPTFCKPDNINRVAVKIRERSKAEGGPDNVWLWLEELHFLNEWQPDPPFVKPKVVAF